MATDNEREFFKGLRTIIDDCEPPAIKCPRCYRPTAHLLKGDRTKFTFVCYNQDCYETWINRESEYVRLQLPQKTALDWKKTRGGCSNRTNMNYQFTPLSMTLLDRKRSLKKYRLCAELMVNHGLGLPSPTAIEKYCGVKYLSAVRIRDTIYKAMQPMIFEPPTKYKAVQPRLSESPTKFEPEWHIDYRDIFLENIDVRVMMALKLRGTDSRITKSHIKKFRHLGLDPDEAKLLRDSIRYANKFKVLNVRLAYYTDTERPSLGFLHTYFTGKKPMRFRPPRFHVMAEQGIFPINRINTRGELQKLRLEAFPELIGMDQPTGFDYWNFYKSTNKPQRGTDRYIERKEMIEIEFDKIEETWKDSNLPDNDFGRFLCAYMYFRNHELAETIPTTEDLCKRLITPRSFNELNLRLTLEPGVGAPPITRD